MIGVNEKHGPSSTELRAAYPLAEAIERRLGNSKITTDTHFKSTPEQALLEALKEADEPWVLPDLEINI